MTEATLIALAGKSICGGMGLGGWFEKSSKVGAHSKVVSGEAEGKGFGIKGRLVFRPPMRFRRTTLFSVGRSLTEPGTVRRGGGEMESGSKFDSEKLARE